MAVQHLAIQVKRRPRIARGQAFLSYTKNIGKRNQGSMISKIDRMML